jgi:hypothetical protein
MNDLKLLYSFETQLDMSLPSELITFDTNMNRVYVTDHNHIYEIDSTDQKVYLIAFIQQFL